MAVHVLVFLMYGLSITSMIKSHNVIVRVQAHNLDIINLKPLYVPLKKIMSITTFFFLI